VLEVQERLLVVQAHVVGCAGLPTQIQPQRPAHLLLIPHLDGVSYRHAHQVQTLAAPVLPLGYVPRQQGASPVEEHLPLLAAAHRIIAATVLHLPEYAVQVELQPCKDDGLELACAAQAITLLVNC
jgi:hypothetical protein